MKIFGWMNHKIHARKSYSLLSDENGIVMENMKSKNIDEAFGILEESTRALLHTSNNDDQSQVLLLDNLHGWQDGILAIGTFGLHQLLHPYQSDSKPTINCELGQLVLGKDEQEKLVEHFAEDSVAEKLKETPLSNSMEIELTHCGEIIESQANIKEEKRTTLADLFHAEKNIESLQKGKAQILCEKNDVEVSLPTIKMKEEEKKKKQRHGKSLPKKLRTCKGEDPEQPTPKLQRLISRILKKKIHPELGADLNGGTNTCSKPYTIRDVCIKSEKELEKHKLCQGT